MIDGLDGFGLTDHEPWRDFIFQPGDVGFAAFGRGVPDWSKDGLKCVSNRSDIPDLHILCGWGYCSQLLNPNCKGHFLSRVFASWRTVRKP